MEEICFEGKVYRVSYGAMPDLLKEKLGPEELERYLELLQIVQQRPREVYKEIKAFGAEHSDVPEVINLLTFAHIQNHKIVDAEKLIEDTYKAYPDYLFAKVNYADQCIRKKKLDRVPEIFPTFDLQELSPEKEVYHTSEFRGYLIMMAYYYKALKDRERALHYLEGAKKVDPNYPGVIYLDKKLNKVPFLKRLLKQRN